MPYWVYMLFVGQKSRGKNRKIYTGYTQHLGKRITQHSGLNSTKGARLTRKQPIELVYLEKFTSRKQALRREWEFKHKSPFNQKDYKLALIKEFLQSNSEIIKELNDKLMTHFDFLESMIKTINHVEKELKLKIQKRE